MVYDTYDNPQSPDSIPEVPAYDPYGFGQERITGYRSGRPSAWTPMPSDVMPDDYIDEMNILGPEGGGYRYAYETLYPAIEETQGYDPISLGNGAKVRSKGRPPWGENGSRLRAEDQGGAAANREVGGEDWEPGTQLDYGFQNKHPGEVGQYYQEPPDSYFRMGRNFYPETNPPYDNKRAQARGTDAARADIPVRVPGAKQKRYIMSPSTQEAMRPVTYSPFWEGAYHRPDVPRVAVTIANTMGMPDWQYYNMQPSPMGARTIPADPSMTDNLDQAGMQAGYTEEDVYY